MDKENTVKLILYLCKKRKPEIVPTKIYFDNSIKEGIIYGPLDVYDAIYNLKSDGSIITFTPNEDFNKFDKIVKESNLIYQNEEVTK